MSGSWRLGAAGLLVAAGVAGGLFAPVFGLSSLVLPLALVAVAAYGCVELAAWLPRLTGARPVLVLGSGALALLFASAGGSVDVLRRALTDGWLATLQSTWPARPEPEQLLFVPLVTLLASAIGLEVLLRLRKPLVALVPAVGVVVLSQAYQAATGVVAVLGAAGFAAAAGLVLWADQPRAVPIVRALSTVVAVAVGAVLAVGLDPAGRAAYSLREGHAAPVQPSRAISPLAEIAERLADPEREVFRHTGDAVDRWRLVALDGFDGVNWTATGQLRRLGAQAPASSGVGSAQVTTVGLRGPWLPSQTGLLGVDGLAPLVDESAGTLLAEGGGPRDYRLTWALPGVPDLDGGEVDASAGIGDLGAVPPGMDTLAREAVRGVRPTFQAALQLERWLRDNYRVAVGDDLPTGHGWPQLRHFLTESKRGTSEQFAAAYVVLARMNGIPARVVVGYRASADAVVRNKDVLAWPEVAVAGVGWVPLDPTAGAGTAGVEQSELAKAAAEARAKLPSPPDLRSPDVPAVVVASSAPERGVLGFAVVAALAGLAVLFVALIPVIKGIRRVRRRRLSGADGVVAAWDEVRDRLREHGVPWRAGMTARDLAWLAGPVVGEPVARLGRVVDMALWSGTPVSGGSVSRAWGEVGEVRRLLRGRGVFARCRAALSVRVLFR